MSWVYNNFQQQPSFGATFEDAFKRGYGLMDTIYQQQRQNQLRSKLADLYVANPDMEPIERMKKTVPLMALYGDMNKAVEMDKAVQQAEFNQAYKTATLQGQEEARQQRAEDAANRLDMNWNIAKLGSDTRLAIAELMRADKEAAREVPKIKNYSDYVVAWNKLGNKDESGNYMPQDYETPAQYALTRSMIQRGIAADDGKHDAPTVEGSPLKVAAKGGVPQITSKPQAVIGATSKPKAKTSKKKDSLGLF